MGDKGYRVCDMCGAHIYDNSCCKSCLQLLDPLYTFKQKINIFKQNIIFVVSPWLLRCSKKLNEWVKAIESLPVVQWLFSVLGGGR